MSSVKGLIVLGDCIKDGCSCDGESLICRFRPSDVSPVRRDLGDDADRPFFNRDCSNFRKVE